MKYFIVILVFIVFYSLTYADLTTGLLVQYPFDGNANDESGNGNNGAVQGATLMDDRFGNENSAYDFDGVNDYIAFSPLYSSSPEALSISVWIKNGTTGKVMYHGDNGEFQIQKGINSVSWCIKLTNGNWYCVSANIVDGPWIHIVATWEKNNGMKLFINKTLEGTLDIPDLYLYDTGYTHYPYIGALNMYNEFLNGSVDDIRFYDQVLDESEINSLYHLNGWDSISSGLAAYYPFTDNADDLSGNNLHGTVNGATLTSDRFTNADDSFYFDGSNDLIWGGNGHFSSLYDNFTYSLWVRPLSTRNSTPEANSGSSGTYEQRYAIYPDNASHSYAADHSCAGISVGTNGISVFEHTSYYCPSLLVYNTTLSGWNYVVVQYINKQPHLYLNGELVRTGLTSQKIVHPGVNFGEGYANYGYFHGDIDDIRIYERTLSDEEIYELYHQDDWMLPPENITINISGSSVAINWLPVVGATTYKVYSSDEPYSGFTEDTTGTFTEESWSTSGSDVKKFYYVKAVN